MQFEIIYPDWVKIKENGTSRQKQLRHGITIRPLSESWDGAITWTCERTGGTTQFVVIDGEFYEDIQLKLTNDRLPRNLFYDEEKFFLGGGDRAYVEEDIIDWSAAIKKKAVGLRLQGAKLWKHSPGPVLKIASKQYGWHTALVSGQPELRNDHLFSFHFGLDEIGDAKEWLASLVAEGRKGTFGKLKIDGVQGPFLQGAYLDAINVANTVRASFRTISEYDNVPTKAWKNLGGLTRGLGRWEYDFDWPPRYFRLDVRDISPNEARKLLSDSAEIVGLVRTAGKKNFPQQSKNFDRHIRRAEKWMEKIWTWEDEILSKLVNPKPRSKPQDGEDDEDGYTIL